MSGKVVAFRLRFFYEGSRFPQGYRQSLFVSRSHLVRPRLSSFCSRAITSIRVHSMSGIAAPVSGAGALARRSAARPRKSHASWTKRPRRTFVSAPSRATADHDADAAPEDSGDEEFARVRQIKAERRHAHVVGKHRTRVDECIDEDATVIAVTAFRSQDDHDEENEETSTFLSDVLHGNARKEDRLLSSVNRNLALEMVRVTESAAVAAARWLGKGDKMSADAAAVHAMRQKLKEVDFDGVVVVGEGEKDQAPMLFPGERIGSGLGPEADVAVDPVDGTTLIAEGKDGAIAVIAVAERGAMFSPGPIGFYMDKLAVGPECKGAISLQKSPTVNVHAIARAKRKSVADVTCAVLDRDRHLGLIEELRFAGARIKLLKDGDVEAALATCDPNSGVDALFGVGGAAEGVVAAAALRCAGGEIQAQLWPRDAGDASAMRAAGCDLTRILRTEDLCGGEAILVAATGISDGRALRGVRFGECGAQSSSLVMRYPSQTVRRIETTHTWTRAHEPSIASSMDEDEYDRIYVAR